MTTVVQSCPSRESALWISVLENSRYEAIEGARVTVKGPGGHEGTTAADGTLAFESLEPGDYDVEVDIGGLKVEAKVPAAQQCTTTKGGRKTLVFRVEFLDWDLGDLCIVGAPPLTSLCALANDDEWDIGEICIVGASLAALPAAVSDDDGWDLGALQLPADTGSSM